MPISNVTGTSSATAIMSDELPPGVLGPRPYPYPRPQPPPPMPIELSSPLSCYKCHSPEEPLPAADSPEVFAAESYFRQLLSSTWRTHIDVIEAHELANELEAKGILDCYVGHYLDSGDASQALPEEHLKDKETLDANRDKLRECVRAIIISRLLGPMTMAQRMEKVLIRVMTSVLARMGTLGFGNSCLHDVLRSPASTQSMPPYAPAIPSAPVWGGQDFAIGLQHHLSVSDLPILRERLVQADRWGAWVERTAVEAYPAWHALLVECCKREYHKAMYDIQLMMVGGFSLKLLELAWRELQIDKRHKNTVQAKTQVGFQRVVKWCDAGGVRIALWEKGEHERIHQERKKYALKLEQDVEERKKREKSLKDAKKKQERQERRRRRDEDRYDEVLGRLVAIEKERRRLLEESVQLEEERVALENKLMPAETTTRPSTPGDSDGRDGAATEITTAESGQNYTESDLAAVPPAAHTSEPQADADSASAEAAAVAEHQRVTRSYVENVLTLMEHKPPLVSHVAFVAPTEIRSNGHSQPEPATLEEAGLFETGALIEADEDEADLHVARHGGTAAPSEAEALDGDGRDTVGGGSAPVASQVSEQTNGYAEGINAVSGASIEPPSENSETTWALKALENFAPSRDPVVWTKPSLKRPPRSESFDSNARRLDFDRASAVFERTDVAHNADIATSNILASIAPDDFTPGRSLDRHRLYKLGQRASDVFWRQAPRIANDKKGKAKAPPLPPCTCGALDRSKRRRRADRRTPTPDSTREIMSNSTVVADTFTSSMPTSTSDVRRDTLGSNLILAAASATKYASMPHICPVDIHTPDPTNKSAACSATISERIGVSLSTCMIRVFYTVLSEVYAREAYLLFQAHTMSTWSALWHEDEGASVLAFLRDAPDEVKAVEYTVRDVMLVFETRAFQERVAHIALEVATERFLQGITEAYKDLLPRTSASTPPCLCLLDAHPGRVTDALVAFVPLKTLDAGDPPDDVLSYPFSDEDSTEAIAHCYRYSTADTTNASVTREEFFEAHRKCWDIYRSHADLYDYLEMLPVKHAARMLATQGGVSCYRMAVRQQRAIQLSAGLDGPLKYWKLSTADAYLKPDQQLFRQENQHAQVSQRVPYTSESDNVIDDLSIVLLLRPMSPPSTFLARAGILLKLNTRWSLSEALYDAGMGLALLGPEDAHIVADAYRLRSTALVKLGRFEDAYADFVRNTMEKGDKALAALIGANKLPAKELLPVHLHPPPSIKQGDPDDVGICPPLLCRARSPLDQLTTSRPEWADATGDLIVNAFSYALALEIRRTFKDEIHAVITDILWQAQRSPDAPPLSEIASDPEAWIMKHESNMAVGPIDALKASLGTGPERQLSMVRLLQRAAWVFRQIIYGIPDLPASKQCICILNSEKFHFYLRKMCTVFENMTKSVPAPGYPQDARKKLRADVEEWCKRRDKSPPDDSWFQSLDRIQERSYAALWLLIRDRAKGQLDPSKQFVGVRKVLRNIGGVRLYSIIAGASDDPQTPWLDEAEEFRAIVQVGADDAKPFSEDRAGMFEDMADVFFGAQQGQEALEHYSSAIVVKPSAKAFVRRVRLLRRMDDLDPDDRAKRNYWIVKDCTAAIVRQPWNADAFAYRAQALRDLDHSGAAFRDLTRAFALQPLHPLVAELGCSIITRVPTALVMTANSPFPSAIPHEYLSSLQWTLVSTVPFESTRITPLISNVETKGRTAGTRNPSPESTTARNTQTTRVVHEDCEDETFAPDPQVITSISRAKSGSGPTAMSAQLLQIGYTEDSRSACPPIRCSGALPVTANFDSLDALLLNIFLLAHQIAAIENRAPFTASIRDALLRRYILTKTGWEKGNAEAPDLRKDMAQLCREHVESLKARGMSRADRGLKTWLNGVLLTLESLPVRQPKTSLRDCCTCLLSGQLDHVREVENRLRRRLGDLEAEPGTFIPASVSTIVDWCRGQVKAGKLASRSTIWNSAPKWRAQVERLVNVFDANFETTLADQLEVYSELETDYRFVAHLVGGIATFEAAHRLLLPPDPPEPGRVTPPLAVEDVTSWAAFVATYAPYDIPLSTLGVQGTKVLAESKVLEAAELFRDGKYLLAIRAYSIAAIWADDRAAEADDEGRRTLRRTIYGQLSYLRTLFPSNRQWMSAVADATLAVACSRGDELPTALDLRSTALHGIRHYKFALSDLEDAARIDPMKGAGWEERLTEMHRAVPVESRVKSRFSERLDKLSGH